jgi:Zn-dependent metalloprotease
MRETGRGDGIQTWDMNQGTNYGSAVDFTNATNVWNNVNANQDEVAGDAHWGTEVTYDYFWLEHNRNSIDDNGFALYSYVHYDANYGNAFWDGQRMTYGDGDGSTTAFTALDITAHEITHGLTTFTANLEYANESGALSEGFSDIFGTCAEFYGKPSTANWTCGEDIGTIIRSLINPNSSGNPDTYLGTNWDPGMQVHQNSTICSHWFYRLSEGGSGTNDNGDAFNVSGIGKVDASKIAFLTLTGYLTTNSDYADARFYSIIAASDIFTGCSPEVESTTNAWYAVGVGNSYVPTVVPDFSADYTTVCSAPLTVQFSNATVNANTYKWSFGDGGTSTLANPSHTYASPGNYSVKIVGDGGSCGKDSLTRINYISINASSHCFASG